MASWSILCFLISYIDELSFFCKDLAPYFELNLAIFLFLKENKLGFRRDGSDDSWDSKSYEFLREASKIVRCLYLFD